MKKGISLIVLILTIIIIIIISGAIILSLSESDIIDKAEEAVEAHNISELKNIASVFAVEYRLSDLNKTCKDYVKEKLLASGFDKKILNEIYITEQCTVIVDEENIKKYQEKDIRKVHEKKLKDAYNYDLTEETIDEMIELMNAANIPADALFVWYDKKDNEDYIGYRLDKVTYEQCVVLENIYNEETGTHYMFLPGDVNLDGLLTEDDTDMIESYALSIDTMDTYCQLYIAQSHIVGEENNYMRTQSLDASIFGELILGVYSYIEIIENLHIEEANYTHDGVNYFTNEELRNKTKV